MSHIIKPHLYVFLAFSFGVGHAHFCSNFPFAKLQQMKNILFQTPPRQFEWFAPNFAWSICGPYWQKAIKRILIVHKIVRNIQQQIPAYCVESRQSRKSLQNTVWLSCKCCNCVPWTDEAVCKIWCKSAKRWRFGRRLVSFNGKCMEKS